MDCVEEPVIVLSEDSTLMILFSIRNCNDLINSSSGILSVAHHPAVFLIHTGTVSGIFNVNTSGFSASLYRYFFTFFVANS